ncbi:MAG: glycosyltransferase family 4 protein [Candidatus Eremiobacteraeota bacterium]|nr:glycosyltransferase family 4 protein [Candidatus Eremiobacteraeota bacterium]
MNRGRLLVVGDPFFLARHRPLTRALAKRRDGVEELAVDEGVTPHEIAVLAGAFVTGRLWPPTRANAGLARQRYRKTAARFARMSERTAGAVAERSDVDLVLHVFSMASPAAPAPAPPYAHYIDMTMAQVRRDWPPWAPFENERAYAAWIAKEGATYRGAARVFTFSEAARRSVIEDYGADPARVVAVGAAGFYNETDVRPRAYGNRTIVFNGSEFERKGGDRVLAAFRIVRARFPDASLTIVANDGIASEPGISLRGRVDRTALFEIFERTDVVLAPTRFDGFPGFVLEAMSRGVVPVLSDAEPMGEIVTDGVDGFVVSPPTPERLAATIVALFENPSSLGSLGAAARERVERDLNWDAVAARMLASLARDSLL